MATVIDSSLWVDYFRSKTPRVIKEQIATYVESSTAVLCQPVRFEILRAASKGERNSIKETFETIPVLSSPENLWDEAAKLGQDCVDLGFLPRSLDLLIAVICVHHQVQITTFDTHFAQLGRACPIDVNLLRRNT
jgi:predicted nucleic acid-binding protein